MNPYEKNILEENLHLIDSPFGLYPECLRDLFLQATERLRAKTLTTREGVVKQVCFDIVENYGSDFEYWDKSVSRVVHRLTKPQLYQVALQSEDFSDISNILDKPDQMTKKLIASLNRQIEQNYCPRSEEEVSIYDIYENIQETKAYEYLDWQRWHDTDGWYGDFDTPPPALFSSEAIYAALLDAVYAQVKINPFEDEQNYLQQCEMIIKVLLKELPYEDLVKVTNDDSQRMEWGLCESLLINLTPTRGLHPDLLNGKSCKPTSKHSRHSMALKIALSSICRSNLDIEKIKYIVDLTVAHLEDNEKLYNLADEDNAHSEVQPHVQYSPSENSLTRENIKMWLHDLLMGFFTGEKNKHWQTTLEALYEDIIKPPSEQFSRAQRKFEAAQ